MNEKRKVFISFYHEDIDWKNYLLNINKQKNIFIDWSVDTNDISDDLTDEEIRVKIRDEYIRESSITIVLASSESLKRKHVDWEIGSSMIDTKNNKRSGIIIILIRDLLSENILINDKSTRNEYPNVTSWKNVNENNFSNDYKYITNKRLYINLEKWVKKVNNSIPIQIISMKDIDLNSNVLVKAIDFAYENRDKGTYDTSIPFQRKNLN